MDVGVAVFAGSYGLAPPALGRAVEARGFESLFYAEHTHIPVASRRPDGRPVRPIAEGHFLFGVGAGWNREELLNHGTDPRTRMGLLAHRVHAMRRIWTEDEAEYHGSFVDFDPIWSWPKPVQRPHPPVLVGGNGPGTEDRVLDFGGGWIPQSGPLESVKELGQRVGALQRRAADAGRAPIPVTLWGAIPDGALLEAFAEAGVDRCLLTLGPGDTAELLATLDDWAALTRRYRDGASPGRGGEPPGNS